MSNYPMTATHFEVKSVTEHVLIITALRLLAREMDNGAVHLDDGDIGGHYLALAGRDVAPTAEDAHDLADAIANTWAREVQS